MTRLTDIIQNLATKVKTNAALTAEENKNIRAEIPKLLADDKDGTLLHGTADNDLTKTRPPFLMLMEILFENFNNFRKTPRSELNTLIVDIVQHLVKDPKIGDNEFSAYAYCIASMIVEQLRKSLPFKHFKSIKKMREFNSDSKALFAIIDYVENHPDNALPGNPYAAFLEIHRIALAFQTKANQVNLPSNDSKDPLKSITERTLSRIAIALFSLLYQKTTNKLQAELTFHLVIHLCNIDPLFTVQITARKEKAANMHFLPPPFLAAISKYITDNNALQALAFLNKCLENNTTDIDNHDLYLLASAFEQQLTSPGRKEHSIELYIRGIEHLNNLIVERFKKLAHDAGTKHYTGEINNENKILVNRLINLINHLPDAKQQQLFAHIKCEMEEVLRINKLNDEHTKLLDATHYYLFYMSDICLHKAAIELKEAQETLGKCEQLIIVTAELKKKYPLAHISDVGTERKKVLARRVADLEKVLKVQALNVDFAEVAQIKLANANSLFLRITAYETIINSAAALQNPERLIERCIEQLQSLIKHAIPKGKECANKTRMQILITFAERQMLLANTIDSAAEAKLNALSLTGDAESFQKLFEFHKNENNIGRTLFNAARVAITSKSNAATASDSKEKDHKNTESTGYAHLKQCDTLIASFYVFLINSVRDQHSTVNPTALIIYAVNNIYILGLNEKTNTAIANSINQSMTSSKITADVRNNLIEQISPQEKLVFGLILNTMRDEIAASGNDSELGRAVKSMTVATSASLPTVTDKPQSLFHGGGDHTSGQNNALHPYSGPTFAMLPDG